MPFQETNSVRAWRQQPRVSLVFGMIVTLLITSGCRKNIAEEASDSDANGYLCTKCGAKLYTNRAVFLGAACPKCKADGIVEVVGYYCDKDNHMTLAGRNNQRVGPACEKCGEPLNAMRLPREKDLKAWGATKTLN